MWRTATEPLHWPGTPAREESETHMWFPAAISWHKFEARLLQQMGLAAGPLHFSYFGDA